MTASHLLPAVQRMLDEPGYYLAVDGSGLGPQFEAPLISRDGKVYCVIAETMAISRELDPAGFFHTVKLEGPLSYEKWAGSK